jgi:hypothetical protein
VLRIFIVVSPTSRLLQYSTVYCAYRMDSINTRLSASVVWMCPMKVHLALSVAEAEAEDEVFALVVVLLWSSLALDMDMAGCWYC